MSLVKKAELQQHMYDKRKQCSSSRSNNVTNTFYIKGAFFYSNSRLFSRNRHDGWICGSAHVVAAAVDGNSLQKKESRQWIVELVWLARHLDLCHRTTASRFVACRNSMFLRKLMVLL
jgi:hypothetical protein